MTEESAYIVVESRVWHNDIVIVKWRRQWAPPRLLDSHDTRRTTCTLLESFLFVKSANMAYFRSGMHNLRPAGRIRPPNLLYPALGAG